MKIKPCGSYLVLLTGTLFAWSLFAYLIFVEWDHAALKEVFVFFLTPFFLLLELLDLCLEGKTILLERDGVTVSLLGFRRRYPWSAYVTRELRDFTEIGGAGSLIAGRGVLFSRSEKARRPWEGPMMYCSRHRPFSSFYLAFAAGDRLRPNIYVVDEEKFLTAMGEWGVELQSGFRDF